MSSVDGVTELVHTKSPLKSIRLVFPAVAILGLAVAMVFSFGSGEAKAAADKPTITAFLTTAVQSDNEQTELAGSPATLRGNSGGLTRLQDRISTAHRKVWGGAMLTKRLNSDLSWARSAAMGPVLRTLVSRVSDMKIATLTVDTNYATVTGTYSIYHKDAEPVDAAGHEFITAFTNTMYFEGTLDRSSGHWLITEWRTMSLDATEDTAARSGDQYLPKNQAKPTLPPLVPVPVKP